MLSIGSLLVEGPTPTAAPGDAVEDAEGAAHSACAGEAPRQRRGRRYDQKARSKQPTQLLRIRVRVRFFRPRIPLRIRFRSRVLSLARSRSHPGFGYEFGSMTR